MLLYGIGWIIQLSTIIIGSQAIVIQLKLNNILTLGQPVFNNCGSMFISDGTWHN